MASSRPRTLRRIPATAPLRPPPPSPSYPATFVTGSRLQALLSPSHQSKAVEQLARVLLAGRPSSHLHLQHTLMVFLRAVSTTQTNAAAAGASAVEIISTNGESLYQGPYTAIFGRLTDSLELLFRCQSAKGTPEGHAVYKVTFCGHPAYATAAAHAYTFAFNCIVYLSQDGNRNRPSPLEFCSSLLLAAQSRLPERCPPPQILEVQTLQPGDTPSTDTGTLYDSHGVAEWLSRAEGDQPKLVSDENLSDDLGRPATTRSDLDLPETRTH